MITKEQYDAALKIVEDYTKQEKLAREKAESERQAKLYQDYLNCGEHRYLPMGKWSSGVQCAFCKHIIN